MPTKIPIIKIQDFCEKHCDTLLKDIKKVERRQKQTMSADKKMRDHQFLSR